MVYLKDKLFLMNDVRPHMQRTVSIFVANTGKEKEMAREGFVNHDQHTHQATRPSFKLSSNFQTLLPANDDRPCFYV